MTGSSARLPDDSARTGVLLHHAGVLPDTSLLLDGTPATAAASGRDFQLALPVVRTMRSWGPANLSARRSAFPRTDRGSSLPPPVRR